MIRLSGPTVTTTNLELVTLADLKTFLNTSAQSADDTRKQQVVDGVNRSAYERMRRRFIKHNSTNWDLVLDGVAYGGRTLALPYRPIFAWTSIARGYYSTGGWVNEY